MDQTFAHEPVMVAEIVDLFAPVPPGTVLDATVGGGGHAEAILDARDDVRVVGVDRDEDAVRAARRRLGRFGRRAVVHHAPFRRLLDVATSEGSPPGTVSGVLFDLGVSSYQLDTAERGFSYRHDAPLDMRMDAGDPGSPTAATIVNTYSEGELRALLVANGEGRMAGRLARAIVAGRPFTSTIELADAVAAAVPAAARRHGHPARRVFQALRIAANDELGQLASTVPAAIEALAPCGRCLAVAYHSGEDRIVKGAFADAVTGGCVCPSGLPCACGAVPVGRLVHRGARRPTADEVAANPRARSARLRAIERLATSAPVPEA